MQDKEVIPPIFCDVCGCKMDASGGFKVQCDNCIRLDRTPTMRSIGRSMARNVPYWTYIADRQEFERMASERGFMAMADGSIVASETLGERLRNERTNSFHVGEDLSRHESTIVKERW
jgi:hypothetical protein